MISFCATINNLKEDQNHLSTSMVNNFILDIDTQSTTVELFKNELQKLKFFLDEYIYSDLWYIGNVLNIEKDRIENFTIRLKDINIEKLSRLNLNLINMYNNSIKLMTYYNTLSINDQEELKNFTHRYKKEWTKNKSISLIIESIFMILLQIQKQNIEQQTLIEYIKINNNIDQVLVITNIPKIYSIPCRENSNFKNQYRDLKTFLTNIYNQSSSNLVKFLLNKSISENANQAQILNEINNLGLLNYIIDIIVEHINQNKKANCELLKNYKTVINFMKHFNDEEKQLTFKEQMNIIKDNLQAILEQKEVKKHNCFSKLIFQ